MKRLIYFLMTLLGFGFQSCDIRAEYGSPHVHFRLTARVIDEQGAPIQGIHVRTSKGESFDYDTGVSDYMGNVDAYGTIWPEAQYEVVFEDIDGPLNGGEFETLTLRTNAQQTEAGDDNWYSGGYVADMGDVVLKKKETIEAE